MRCEVAPRIAVASAKKREVPAAVHEFRETARRTCRSVLRNFLLGIAQLRLAVTSPAWLPASICRLPTLIRKSADLDIALQDEPKPLSPGPLFAFTGSKEQQLAWSQWCRIE